MMISNTGSILIDFQVNSCLCSVRSTMRIRLR